MGQQVSKRFIQDDAVGATKILLENNLAQRARNMANSADIDLFKLSAADIATLLGIWDYIAVVSGTDPKEVVNVEYLDSNVLAGKVLATSFTGSPKKVTVTLSPALSSVNYSVAVSGVDVRAWTIENQTINSFVINANANLALTGDVKWQIQLN